MRAILSLKDLARPPQFPVPMRVEKPSANFLKKKSAQTINWFYIKFDPINEGVNEMVFS
jgi:hypothetical protein